VTGRGGRIGVIGAAGQLGEAVTRAFAGGDVVMTVRRDPRHGQLLLDLGEPASIRAALDEAKPGVLVLAAAMCHVDGCEQDPATCGTVNVEGTRAVAGWAARHDARVVFFSTDHVFDGTAPISGEDDAVNPLNAYARSKVAGERILRELLPERHVILRTAWLYGPDRARRNFALRLVDRLRAGERVPVPSDQWGAPTYTADLAAATRFVVERDIAGTFHATGPELVDRVSLAQRIAARFGVDARGIVPTATADLRQPARRPLRVALRCDRLAALGAPAFRRIDAGLEELHAWVTGDGRQ
jgi:dTDP-4-dehydrorhamnose reductase